MVVLMLIKDENSITNKIFMIKTSIAIGAIVGLVLAVVYLFIQNNKNRQTAEGFDIFMKSWNDQDKNIDKGIPIN